MKQTKRFYPTIITALGMTVDDKGRLARVWPEWRTVKDKNGQPTEVSETKYLMYKGKHLCWPWHTMPPEDVHVFNPLKEKMGEAAALTPANIVATTCGNDYVNVLTHSLMRTMAVAALDEEIQRGMTVEQRTMIASIGVVPSSFLKTFDTTWRGQDIIGTSPLMVVSSTTRSNRGRRLFHNSAVCPFIDELGAGEARVINGQKWTKDNIGVLTRIYVDRIFPWIYDERTRYRAQIESNDTTDYALAPVFMNYFVKLLEVLDAIRLAGSVIDKQWQQSLPVRINLDYIDELAEMIPLLGEMATEVLAMDANIMNEQPKENSVISAAIARHKVTPPATSTAYAAATAAPQQQYAPSIPVVTSQLAPQAVQYVAPPPPGIPVPPPTPVSSASSKVEMVNGTPVMVADPAQYAPRMQPQQWPPQQMPQAPWPPQMMYPQMQPPPQFYGAPPPPPGYYPQGYPMPQGAPQFYNAPRSNLSPQNAALSNYLAGFR